MARPYAELVGRMDPIRRERAQEQARFDLERRCRHYDSDGRGELIQCAQEGQQVRLPCPAGRPDATSSYCDAHGGLDRARAEAERDWMYVAPESVGGPREVENAGCQQLQTPHAYIVLKQSPAAQGGTWLAWLGLGSLMQQVENPTPRVRPGKEGLARKRGGRRYSGRNGALAFPTRQAALQQAQVVWRSGLEARVAEIRHERGGTLDWGTPIEPLDSPIVIVLEQGDPRGAWDIAVQLPRRSREGSASLTGLRPSGECA